MPGVNIGQGDSPILRGSCVLVDREARCHYFDGKWQLFALFGGELA